MVNVGIKWLRMMQIACKNALWKGWWGRLEGCSLDRGCQMARVGFSRTGEGGVEQTEPCLKDRLTIPGSSSIADTENCLVPELPCSLLLNYTVRYGWDRTPPCSCWAARQVLEVCMELELLCISEEEETEVTRAGIPIGRLNITYHLIKIILSHIQIQSFVKLVCIGFSEGWSSNPGQWQNVHKLRSCTLWSLLPSWSIIFYFLSL